MGNNKYIDDFIRQQEMEKLKDAIRVDRDNGFSRDFVLGYLIGCANKEFEEHVPDSEKQNIENNIRLLVCDIYSEDR